MEVECNLPFIYLKFKTYCIMYITDFSVILILCTLKKYIFRWLGFRLEFVGALIVFTTALFSVIAKGNNNSNFSSLVGLSISYALQVREAGE